MDRTTHHDLPSEAANLAARAGFVELIFPSLDDATSTIGDSQPGYVVSGEVHVLFERPEGMPPDFYTAPTCRAGPSSSTHPQAKQPRWMRWMRCCGGLLNGWQGRWMS
jgi:hypothetical protein